MSGAALMAMLVIVVVGISAMLISSLSAARLKNARQKTISSALAQAKEALVSYAVTYGDTHAGQVHGYLPCPDIDGKDISGNPAEGSTKLSCGAKNVSSIGRLPWKTLELPALRDGDGECLWYAIAGNYKNNPKTDLMNWDNNGLFEILDANGATIAQNVAAVVFAPGSALGSQSRAPDGAAPVCGGNYTASNYLDNAAVSDIANAISQFRLGASAQMNDQINDQMIFITKDDIFNAIMRRSDFADPARNPLRLMARRAAECIADYGRRNSAGVADKRLPWPGILFDPAEDYWTSGNYDDESGLLSGRLPFRVNASDSATSNAIVSPHYQLKSDGSNCPGVPEWPAYYPWWANWKDHLFYALADSFKPGGGSAACGVCLTVNSTGTHAAVVAFSGKKLAGQTRASGADRLNFANYLEGRNFTNHPNTPGNGDYQSGAETGSFNDVLYCIKPDLTVAPC